MLEIVESYLKYRDVPSSASGIASHEIAAMPDYLFVIWKHKDFIPTKASSQTEFNYFLKLLDTRLYNYGKTRSLTLQQALVQAGRLDPMMRQAQVEYFVKEYLNPAFNFCDQNGLKYPVSKLIASGATLLNGYSGFKSKIRPFLKGGNEIAEMTAFAQHLLRTMNQATGMNVSYRAQTYLNLLQTDPNLSRPYTVKGRYVPVKVTLDMIIKGQVPNAAQESSFDGLYDDIGGVSAYPAYDDMNGSYGDPTATAFFDMDSGYSDNGLMGAGFDDMGFDDFSDFGGGMYPQQAANLSGCGCGCNSCGDKPAPYLGAYTIDQALDRLNQGINVRGGVRGYGPAGSWGSYNRHQAHMEHNPEYQQWYGLHRDMYQQYGQYHRLWDHGMRPQYFPSTVQPQTYHYYRYRQGNPYTYNPYPYGWVYCTRS
jgi:hypothetical protein